MPPGVEHLGERHEPVTGTVGAQLRHIGDGPLRKDESVGHWLVRRCGTLCCVAEDYVRKIAALLYERNAIDEKIAGIIERPMTAGHLGEWIAAQVFGIELETSAVAAAIDGRFGAGPLQGRTVNVKWYLKREGLVDITDSPVLDYYLVLTGPASAAMSSRRTVRPWCVGSVYLFDAQQLVEEQRSRGVKIGIASSIRAAQWVAAEIYPGAINRSLLLSPAQAELLELFAPSRSTSASSSRTPGDMAP